MCYVYIQWGSIVFGFLSAILWFTSALGKVPDKLSIPVVKSDVEPMGQPLGGTYVGQASSPDLEKIVKSLRKQACLNTWAALCTCIAVLLQAIALAHQIL